MKTTNALTATLLAITGAALVASTAHAATPSYTEGDLFLGFRATANTGATSTYLLNIGQASLYLDATASFTLSLGNIGADLDATFGSDWATRSEVRWGVFGADSDGFGNEFVLFASRAESTIGTAPTPWNRRSEPSQGLTHGKVLNLASAYLDGSTTANSPSSGIIQNTSTTYDWSDFQPGGSQSTANTSFAVYSPGIEGNFGNGAAGTRLDLFQLTPGSGAGTNEGYFAIADTGTISFVAPIPEPGSFVMLLVAGCGMMGFTRHRKSLSA